MSIWFFLRSSSTTDRLGSVTMSENGVFRSVTVAGLGAELFFLAL